MVNRWMGSAGVVGRKALKGVVQTVKGDESDEPDEEGNRGCLERCKKKAG